MNYQEFVCSVTDFLRETLPEETELNLVPLEKNNGVIRDGLAIKKKGNHVAPTIYLDTYYRDYLAGRSLHNIYDQILECCEDCRFIEEFDVTFFSSYEKIRPTIVYKLINYEKNEELLKRIPHLPFLDLAIVFYSLLSETPLGNATVLIHDSHLKMWGISCSQLYQDAKKNTKHLLPAELMNMKDVLQELCREPHTSENPEIPMYVLSNTKRSLGAAVLLYEEMPKICARHLGEAYYLLPSSIHEWILLPKSMVSDEEELKAMVRDINETQVRDVEILSDQVYFYSPESEQIFRI